MQHQTVKLKRLCDSCLGRDKGEGVRNSLLHRFDDGRPNTVFVVDIDDIKFMNYSFADEVFGKIQADILAGDIVRRFLTVKGENSEVFDEISASMVRRKINLIAIKDEEPTLVGALQDEPKQNLIPTFNFVNSVGEVTANDVAKKFNIAKTTANNRLKRLCDRKLIVRDSEEMSGGGRQYVYKSIIP